MSYAQLHALRKGIKERRKARNSPEERKRPASDSISSISTPPARALPPPEPTAASSPPPLPLDSDDVVRSEGTAVKEGDLGLATVGDTPPSHLNGEAYFRYELLGLLERRKELEGVLGEEVAESERLSEALERVWDRSAFLSAQEEAASARERMAQESAVSLAREGLGMVEHGETVESGGDEGDGVKESSGVSPSSPSSLSARAGRLRETLRQLEEALREVEGKRKRVRMERDVAEERRKERRWRMKEKWKVVLGRLETEEEAAMRREEEVREEVGRVEDKVQECKALETEVELMKLTLKLQRQQTLSRSIQDLRTTAARERRKLRDRRDLLQARCEQRRKVLKDIRARTTRTRAQIQSIDDQIEALSVDTRHLIQLLRQTMDKKYKKVRTT